MKGKKNPTVKTILDDWKPSNVSSLTDKELRQVTSTLISAANKRLKRLEAADETTGIAYRFAMEDTEGKFSIRGKSFNETRAEFKRVYRFLNLPSSSVSEAKKERLKFEERFAERTDYDAEKFSKADIKRYYSLIGKFRELYPDKQFKYDEKVLARLVKGHRSEGKILEEMKRTADENYERLQEEEWVIEGAEWEEL